MICDFSQKSFLFCLTFRLALFSDLSPTFVSKFLKSHPILTLDSSPATYAMVNLSRKYCAYFGEATEVWKRYVIGEIIVAFDEYRDSVCQTLQDADNSEPDAFTGSGQDTNNQEEMFGHVQNVLENAQQQAEQRIVSALNQTLNQPPPVSLSPVVSIVANHTAQVNPPGESAISQSGVNFGQNDADDSLNVSIKSEVDSSSESECESDTDEEEVQVKEEPIEEEEDITVHSGEQTENDNNSNDNHETSDSQNDNSNEAANDPNAQAMIIDDEEANLEEDPNGPVIVVVQYMSPPSSPLNAEQNINSFNSRPNPDIISDNQINMNEDIDSYNQVDHADADADGDLDNDEHVDYMEIEENNLYDHQESDNEGSMIDEENAGEESDHLEDQLNMSDVEDNEEEEEENKEEDMNDEDSSDETTDDDGGEEQAAWNTVGPSTSTGRGSTRQVSKRQTGPDRQSKRPIKVKKSEKLLIITKKLKCTMPGCKKVVKSKSALNGHFLSSHKLKRYRCLVRRCYGKVSTSFTTRAQFTDHLDQVHGRTNRLACHCSKKFNGYKELYSHYWSYHQLGHFACSKDGCTFKPTSTRIKVQHHQYNHREAKYECPVDGCDRSFKQKGGLDNHGLTHTGERPFPCPECDKSFTKKSGLTRHLITHTGERPFPCPECDKSFNRKHHLTTHLRAHLNDKCYKCTWPQCTYSATNSGDVIRHIRMVHFELPRSKRQQAEKNIMDDRDPRDYLAKD